MIRQPACPSKARWPRQCLPISGLELRQRANQASARLTRPPFLVNLRQARALLWTMARWPGSLGCKFFWVGEGERGVGFDGARCKWTNWGRWLGAPSWWRRTWRRSSRTSGTSWRARRAAPTSPVSSCSAPPSRRCRCARGRGHCAASASCKSVNRQRPQQLTLFGGAAALRPRAQHTNLARFVGNPLQ